ncbi:MAG: RNA polymerase sigma factor RpoH [Alphaproteobacteria bacterium]|jgi:RNA polymerase sigma-32 factor|nr:RNA polymerase sigma factor RpoH [Alphaproteobacteria bacterium]
MAVNFQDSRAVLQDYLKSIQDFGTLEFEEEQALAKKWRDEGSRASAERLINAHLRLVVKVAIGFKGYGLPMTEVIQEGNIGLMQAVARFDPDKGFRLSTYAMWWIRAAIQEYVLQNWSLVKIGTTAAQKKLFFNVRKLRNRLQESTAENLSEDMVSFIANELGVKEKEVVSMDQRMMANDQSLNGTVNDDSGSEWVDWLEEDRPNAEQTYSVQEESRHRRKMLLGAIEVLDEREKEIFISRRLTESEITPTLEDLSGRFGISRERVRQLEQRAFQKVQKHMHEQLAVA